MTDTEKKHCGTCVFYRGEECTMGPNEGSERYDDSDACDVYEESGE